MVSHLTGTSCHHTAPYPNLASALPFWTTQHCTYPPTHPSCTAKHLQALGFEVKS